MCRKLCSQLDTAILLHGLNDANHVNKLEDNKKKAEI